MKTLTALAAALLMNCPLLLAQNLPTEIIGSHYRDPTEKAAECYSRGAKALRKAEGETDPAKRQKYYEKAKDELTKSVGYYQSFDSLLALGQVYIALEAPAPGRQACTLALGLKPGNAEAQACVDQASQLVLAAKPASPAH